MFSLDALEEKKLITYLHGKAICFISDFGIKRDSFEINDCFVEVWEKPALKRLTNDRFFIMKEFLFNFTLSKTFLAM